MCAAAVPKSGVDVAFHPVLRSARFPKPTLPGAGVEQTDVSGAEFPKPIFRCGFVADAIDHHDD